MTHGTGLVLERRFPVPGTITTGLVFILMVTSCPSQLTETQQLVLLEICGTLNLKKNMVDPLKFSLKFYLEFLKL